MNAFRIFFLSVLILPLTVACSSRQTAATLDDIESYIQTRPDSALASLRAIDTTSLKTRRLQAHYALLQAIALDKNWIDTTDVGVIMPAVSYYKTHGTAGQKFKSLYYLGRIQQNNADPMSAIVSYTLAEEASVKTDDELTKGLLALAIADIYNKTHSVNKVWEYTQRGREHFLNARDTHRAVITDGRLAMIYQEQRDWGKADSLFRLCMSRLQKDTAYLPIYISQYAAMKVVQPDPDPEGAVSLLKQKYGDYHTPLTLRDYGVYAYASDLLGDNKTCDQILPMIGERTKGQHSQAKYLEYLIAESREDYAHALPMLKEIYERQDSIVYVMLGNTVTQTLEDYYERQAKETKERLMNHRLIVAVTLISLVMAVLALYFWLRQKRMREREAAEKLLRTAEETNKMLQQTNASMENDMDVLKNKFVQFYQEQLERIGLLCEAYTKSKGRGDNRKEEVVYRRVERIVEDINKDDESFALFEAQVNGYFDHVIEHLKSDLRKKGKLSAHDVRFLCYTIAGFDANTISVLLGISLSNVYTRRSRLKERVRSLDSPYADQYSRFF